MKRIFISLLIFLTWTTPVLADTGTAGVAAPILRFGVSARAFAIGSAYGTIVDDATATYWNPAGLGNLPASNFSAMHSELFYGTSYDYIGWATPLKYGGLGISYLRISTPGILLVDNGVNIGEEDADADVFYLAYGWRAGSWKIGVTAKYLQEELPTVSGDAWSVDFGIQKELDEHWRFGMVAQDLAGSNIEWDNGFEEEIPTNYRIGLSYSTEQYIIIYEHEKAGDFDQNHVGFEYSLSEYFKIRSGMLGRDFTAGIGIYKDNYTFDYAYCGGDLGNTHRLSFSVLFK